MPVSIDEDIVGETARHDIPDDDTSLLLGFAPGTVLDSFTELEVTTWELPGILGVLTDSLTKQQAVTKPYQNADTYVWTPAQLTDQLVDNIDERAISISRKWRYAHNSYPPSSLQT